MEKQHTYNSQRYRYKNKSATKEIPWLSLCLTLFLAAVSGFSVLQWQKLNTVKSELQAANENVEFQKSELDVLRAINPYQFAFEQVIPRAVNQGDIFPGWVTRVFPAPRVPGQMINMMDMGAFILDQKKFDLAVHRSYGLETNENVLYRMNGLLPSKKKGRFQIGLEFHYDNGINGANLQSTKMHNCFARLEVNAKRVIDAKIRFAANQSLEKLITGDINVIVGVHPIAASIYCDGDGSLNAKSIQISMSFREPGEVFLQQNRHSVFHVYKPSGA